MKTPMQEFTEWLKAYEYELPLELQVKAKECLEEEKRHINKAYYQGIYDKNEGLIKDDYYHETYSPTISKITITEINTQKQRIIDMMKDDENDGIYDQ
jgi:hypothetical protein